jgi:hypothetical protein
MDFRKILYSGFLIKFIDLLNFGYNRTKITDILPEDLRTFTLLSHGFGSNYKKSVSKLP